MSLFFIICQDNVCASKYALVFIRLMYGEIKEVLGKGDKEKVPPSENCRCEGK